MRFEALLAALRSDLGASRTTLRLDTPGKNFPAVAEATAPGVAPIRADESLDQRGAATARWIMDHRTILVQDDCSTADPPPPAELIAVYGVRAQMLAPVITSDGTLRGWISVHDTRGPRAWQPGDVDRLAAAASEVRRELPRSR